MGETVATGLIFSRDRAMQLDALLDSYWRNCSDASSVDLRVLYIGTSPRHEAQYQAVRDHWSPKIPLTFHRETAFRPDLLRVLGLKDMRSPLGGTVVDRRLPRVLRLSRDVPRVPTTWRHLLFLVDDNLFVDRFSVAEAVRALEGQPAAIGFSLRLGADTTGWFVQGKTQTPPAFTSLGDGMLSYEWEGAQGSYRYPLELSSSIYPADVIAGLLCRATYTNPNTLENALWMSIRRYGIAARWPLLLCHDRSVAFCNAVNRVQTVYPDVRAGEAPEESVDALADAFDEGFRIDTEEFIGFAPHDTHLTVPLNLVKRESAA